MSVSQFVFKFALLLILLPIGIGWLAPALFLVIFEIGLLLMGAWWLDAFLRPLFK